MAKHQAIYDGRVAEREAQKKKGHIRFKKLEWTNYADKVIQRACPDGILTTNRR